MNKLLLLVLLLVQPTAAFAIGQPISDKADIAGCWKRVIYPQAVMDQMSKTDFYHPELQKYQWYCFFEEGVFRVVTSNKDEEYTTEGIRNTYKAFPSVMSWKWIKDSVVWVEHKEDSNLNSHWLITRIGEDMRVFGDNLIPKGSYFMAIPTQDLSNFIVVRVLERLKD